MKTYDITKYTKNYVDYINKYKKGYIKDEKHKIFEYLWDVY